MFLLYFNFTNVNINHLSIKKIHAGCSYTAIYIFVMSYFTRINKKRIDILTPNMRMRNMQCVIHACIR